MLSSLCNNVIQKKPGIKQLTFGKNKNMPQRKIIGWAGIALSLGGAKTTDFNAGIVLGADYLLTDKLVVSVGALGGGLMVGVGLHRGFGR